ncbi:MAG: TadE/TadG family type IV pilus assembly protein [Collinsella sp.]
MSIRMRLREERAQATVEMAVVTPVLLVLALIVYNVMIFASAVARFDRVVPDIVLAHAVASEGEGDEKLCRCLGDGSDSNSECHGRL